MPLYSKLPSDLQEVDVIVGTMVNSRLQNYPRLFLWQGLHELTNVRSLEVT